MTPVPKNLPAVRIQSRAEPSWNGLTRYKMIGAKIPNKKKSKHV